MEQKTIYRLYLAGFSIILALPILPLPFTWWAGYLTPPDWGKTIIFKIVFSLILLLFFYEFLWRRQDELLTRVKPMSKKNITFWFLLALLGSYLLATVFSVDIRESLFGSPYRGGGVINYIFYILFAVLAFLALYKKDWQKLWNVAIGAGVVVSLTGLVSYFGLFSSIFVKQFDALTSTIGGPTILGLYLILLIFPALGFGFQEKRLPKKVFYFASAGLFSLIVLLTISQGAYLGLAIGVLYFLFLYPKPLKDKRVLLVKGGTALFILIVVAIALFIKYQPNNKLNDNYLFATLTDWHMDVSRLSAWKVSWQSFLNRPILGYGPENFQIAFDRHYDPSLPRLQNNPSSSDSWWDRPHNIILNTLSDAGIIGLTCYVLLFSTLFFQLYTLRKSEHNIVSHGLQAALVAYFANLFFNFDSFSSFLILFFLISYAQSLLMGSRELVLNAKKKPVTGFFLRTRKGLIALASLAVLFFVWNLNVKPLLANQKINVAEYFANQGKCAVSLDIMKKGENFHTIIDGYFRIKYVEILKTCFTFSEGQDREFALKGVKLLLESVKTMPHYTRSWLVLGGFTTVLIPREENEVSKKALIAEADGYFQRALELSPKRQEVYLEWIKKHLVSGEYQKVQEKSQTCIDLHENFARCYWYLGISHIYFGNVNAAEQNMAIAGQKGFSPDNSVPPLLHLVNAYSFVKDYPKLIDAYRRLLAITDGPQYHSSLAFIYREQGKYQLAREKALHFLRMMPEAKEEVLLFLQTLAAPYNAPGGSDFPTNLKP